MPTGVEISSSGQIQRKGTPMVSVTTLADVTVTVFGSTKKLLKGNTYDLPNDVAKDLARDGYVEINSGSERLQEKAEMSDSGDIAESRGRFNTVPELGDPNAQAVSRREVAEPQSEPVDIYAEHEAEKRRIEQSIADRIANTFKDPSEKTGNFEDDSEEESLEDIHAKHEKEQVHIEQSVAAGNRDTARRVTTDDKVVLDATDDEHVALITEESDPKAKSKAKN